MRHPGSIHLRIKAEVVETINRSSFVHIRERAQLRQLESLNKNWNRLIRASLIYPN
jgi:hypothetical protein